MSVTIANDGTVVATKLHAYLRTAATAPADFTVATIDALLTGASHFQKVETGFELVSAKGDTVKITTGTDIVTSQELSGTLRALGLSSVDYKALMNQSTGYAQADIDVFLLQAPTAQASGTCAIGQQLYHTYSVNAFVALEVKDGVPIAVTIEWTRTDEATESGIEWDEIVT